MRILALALGLLAASATAALADPFSLTVAAVTSLLTTTGAAAAIGLTGTALTLVANVIAGVVLAGAAYAFSALTGSGQQKIDPSKAKEVFEATEASEIRAVGRVRLGGLKIFGATATPDKFRLILHARSLDGFEKYFLGGREIILRSSDNAVMSKPYRISGTSYIYISSDIGSDSKTAWSGLVSAFPALWTSNHRVRGIAQSLIKYVSPGLTDSKFLKLYQGGPPDLEVIARGERVYDPRDIAQDPADPTTYLWSDNGVLVVFHILRQFPRLTIDDFDLDLISAEADRADTLVDTLAGTEKRSRCWGIIPSEMSKGDLLAQMLQSTGCEVITTRYGKYAVRLVDDDRATDLSIPAKHIIDYDWRSGPESVERPNMLRLKYYSSERNFEMFELDLTGKPWAYIQEEIDRVGEQVMDLDLNFCPSAAQAQRIARRLFAMARSDQGIIVTNMAGMAAWGTRVVEFEMPDFDSTIKTTIGPPRVREGDGRVEIPFITLPDLDPWDYTTHEVAAPPIVPDVTYAGSSVVPAVYNAMLQITYNGGAKEFRTSFSSNFPAGGSAYGGSSGDPTGNVESAYSVKDPNYSVWRQMSNFQASTGMACSYVALDLIGKTVAVRARGTNSDDENTLWSAEYEAVVGVDNSAPSPPTHTIITDPDRVVVIAPNNLRVSYIIVSSPSIYTNHITNVRPGQRVEYTYESGAWTARAYSSNGTASSVYNFTI